jgi:hypothetical protein
MFAFIRYVSIHLKISATVVRSAPEELHIRIRTTSFRGCRIGQGSVAKTEHLQGVHNVLDMVCVRKRRIHNNAVQDKNLLGL